MPKINWDASPDHFVLDVLMALDEARAGVPPNLMGAWLWPTFAQRIVGEGIDRAIHDFLSVHKYKEMMNFLTEVDADRSLADLMSQCWEIYTNGRTSLTEDEFKQISIRKYNTRAKQELLYESGKILLDVYYRALMKSGRLPSYFRSNRAQIEASTR